jgi:hypothetical protein
MNRHKKTPNNRGHFNEKISYIQYFWLRAALSAASLDFSYPHVIDEGNSYGHTVGVSCIYNFEKKAKI